MPRARYTQFRPKVRSRHPSHNPLRTQLPLLPYKTVVRLGSTTIIGDEKDLTPDGVRLSCNLPDAVRVSSNKKHMKACFDTSGVKTAATLSLEDAYEHLESGHSVVVKNHYGSRGTGNHLINTPNQLTFFVQNNEIAHYIIEPYLNYCREYRVHVDINGCFYPTRKMLKNNTPEEQRWYRNDTNCVWILETNELFNRPSNWDEIEHHCSLALKSVGLDVGACDVRVSNHHTPKFAVIEINSAPSFGEITLQKYLERIPKIFETKARVFDNQ